MIYALTFLLVVVLAGSLLFAFSGEDKASKRLALVKQEGEPEVSVEQLIAKRRRNVQSALKRLEQKRTKKKVRMTLRQRLDQAGFADVPVRRFWVLSAILGVGVLVVNLIGEETLLVTVLTTFVASLGLPNWGLAFLQKRRRKKFTDDFASAMDVIVRSVRSGLPSFEALKMVGSEYRPPVGGEFKQLVEDVRVGLSMDQALQRMFDRMPTPEVGFFCVVMSVQHKSGGNLAEALNNLAMVLRDRKRLEGKIRSMSAEAKSTALIIGALPVVVMTMLYMTTPAYILLLFQERVGNLLLGACVFWMSIGTLIMRQMINFKH